MATGIIGSNDADGAAVWLEENVKRIWRLPVVPRLKNPYSGQCKGVNKNSSPILVKIMPKILSKIVCIICVSSHLLCRLPFL